MVLRFEEIAHFVIRWQILLLKPFVLMLNLAFERLEVLLMIKKRDRMVLADLMPRFVTRFVSFEPCLGIGSDLFDEAEQRAVEFVEPTLKKLMSLLFAEVTCGEAIRNARSDDGCDGVSAKRFRDVPNCDNQFQCAG